MFSLNTQHEERFLSTADLPQCKYYRRDVASSPFYVTSAFWPVIQSSNRKSRNVPHFDKITKIDHLNLLNISYLGYKLSFFKILFWGVEYPFKKIAKFNGTQ